MRRMARWSGFVFCVLSASALLASRAAAGPCIGDCGGDGTVTIDDLIKGVNIALDNATASACPSFDINGDGVVTIDEIIQAVNAALNGCTPAASATPTAIPTAAATPTPTGVIALFHLDATNPDNPFPSDRLLDATGHVALPLAYLNAEIPPDSKYSALRTLSAKTVSQLSALDGFGTFTPLRIRFSQPMVVEDGENPPGIYVLEYNDLNARPARVTASAYGPDSSIEVQPVVPFKPKTTYAVVVTTDLTDVNGSHVKPSGDFAQLLAGTNLTDDQAAWLAKLQPVIAFVNDAFGVDSSALALVDVFTTEHTTDDLMAIQQRLNTGADLVPGAPCFANCAIPNFTTGIFPENTDGYKSLIGSDTSSNVSAVAIGVFDSYDFRTGADGHFDPGAVNGPTVPKVNHLDFYVTIPKGPMPPNGYPIAIYGHTLGGDGTEVGMIARLNANIPIMSIGISDVDFGRRGNMINFFALNNFVTLRENFRQTVADYLQETKMVENAHTAGIPPFDMIDPQNILYLGASLGGIMGSMYMAVEPDVKIGLLSVPGGGLTHILETPEIGAFLLPLVSLVTGVSTDDPYYPQFFHGFQQTAQWGIDAGDPINYGPYIAVPGNQLPGVPLKHVLVQEGFIDTVVGNRATEDLARAMQLPDLNLSGGCMDPDGCTGIWRYVMTDYGQKETDGHYVTLYVQQATQQAFDYLTSFGTVVDDVHP